MRWKNQYFSQVRSTSENADIFPARDEIYLVFAEKSKFSFYFILNGNTEITTLLFTWSFLVRFDFCSVFIGYTIGCIRSSHLENGLESYLNEWNARNQHLKKAYWVCLRVGVTCKLALRQVKQCIIMFDVDVTTCVALSLTNILHLKPYVKKSQSQNCQESLVLLQFYSILQWKYKSYHCRKIPILLTFDMHWIHCLW